MQLKITYVMNKVPNHPQPLPEAETDLAQPEGCLIVVACDVKLCGCLRRKYDIENCIIANFVYPHNHNHQI